MTHLRVSGNALIAGEAVIATCGHVDDARRIARMCNTYDELLAALKALIDHHIILDECDAVVRAAIANAEGTKP